LALLAQTAARREGPVAAAVLFEEGLDQEGHLERGERERESEMVIARLIHF
jgi:hypothetical protein